MRAPGAPPECKGGWVSVQRKTRRGWHEIKRVPVGYGRSTFYFPGRAAVTSYRAVALTHRIGWDVCTRAVSETLRK